MLRIISLKIYDHPFLNIINEGLNFIPENEIKNTETPYTSVIIGSNGTGKSTLLAIIAEIFDDLNRVINKSKLQPKLRFQYEITYSLNNKTYQVVHYPRSTVKDKDRKNIKFKLFIDGQGKEDLSDLKIPSKVIAISYLANDRFRAKKNEPGDYYIYLGLRDQTNTARTRGFLNNTLPVLFDYVIKEKSVSFLKNILNFLKMNPDYLGLSFEYRYKKAFFKGNLTVKKFETLFEKYHSFTGREETPYGVEYFKANIHGKNELIMRLVAYLNARTIEEAITYGKKSYLNFNLFENEQFFDELELINHLRKLDIISSASLMVRKGTQEPHDADEISSGEFHFLTTMIAIQSSIDKNTLLLIDEPEISFHPNWQLRYIHNLKDLFKKWNSAHFILSTHSHFLISDLEAETSEVIGLTGTIPNVKAKPILKSTYGWSAEQILFEVFGMATDRNFYLSGLVEDIINEMAKPKPNAKVIAKKTEELNKYDIKQLHDKDPFKPIIKQLQYNVANQ